MSPQYANVRLQRSTPEAQGIPTTALDAFLNEAHKNIHDLHSVMLLRHGHVVMEGWWKPYEASMPHMLYSLSKSFTSSAIGLAVSEGLLTIDDPVISFFPDDTPAEVSDNLAAMQVRHLLSMNTGHHDDTTGKLRNNGETNWVKAFLALPVEHEPGTHFCYNSGASYMLSAIIQKLTDQTVLDYLTLRLFQPLGIENASWQCCPRGINTGGWGLAITTEDIACFGQMLLDKGRWRGERILPEEWVAMASSFYSDNSVARDDIDWQQGYGFQYWLCRHNAYRGDGAFGQFCVVMPAQDAVFVTTAGVQDMQAVLNLVWKHLLPAMQHEALPENSAAVQRLEERLASLSLPAKLGNESSQAESNLSGKTYALGENELDLRAMQLEFADDSIWITLTDERGEHRIRCGRGEWHVEEVDLSLMNVGMMSTNVLATTCGWEDENTLHISFCLVETPHILSLNCQFDDDQVTISPELNVSFDEEGIPPIKGQYT